MSDKNTLLFRRKINQTAISRVTKNTKSVKILTLARTCNPPPLRFFADSEKTAARSAARFWGTLWGKPCATFGKKKIDQVRSGHGAMTS